MRLKYLCSSFSNSLTQSVVKSEGQYKVYGASGLIGFLDEYEVGVPYLGIVKDGAGVGRVQKYEEYSSLLGTLAYIIPNDKADINWLKYVVQGLDLGKDVGKTTIPHIYFSEYGNREVTYVNKSLQKRIANFLDAECARIDAIIEQTRSSIEEYKKLKQSVITEAVTKGIRGARPMKDSGVEWIGEIPEDWDARPIKSSFVIISGATPKSDNPDYWDGDVVWVTPADYKFEDKYITNGKRNISQAGYDSCGTTLVPAGSIVFSKRAPIGTVAITSCSLCTNQGCLSCVPKPGISALFFYYTMAAYSELFNLYGTGTTFKEISYTAFSNFKLPLPPVEEQKEIALWLELKCDELERSIRIKDHLISELETYKKSLIYEYVTGKKEAPIS